MLLVSPPQSYSGPAPGPWRTSGAGRRWPWASPWSTPSAASPSSPPTTGGSSQAGSSEESRPQCSSLHSSHGEHHSSITNINLVSWYFLFYTPGMCTSTQSVMDSPPSGLGSHSQWRHSGTGSSPSWPASSLTSLQRAWALAPSPPSWWPWLPW